MGGASLRPIHVGSWSHFHCTPIEAKFWVFKNQTQFIQTSIDSESWCIYIRRYVQDPNRLWDVYLDQHLMQLMFCILYFHFLVFYKKRDNSCQDSFVFITGCVSEVKEGAPANMIHGLDNGLLKLPKLPNFLFPHFFFAFVTS